MYKQLVFNKCLPLLSYLISKRATILFRQCPWIDNALYRLDVSNTFFTTINLLWTYMVGSDSSSQFFELRLASNWKRIIQWKREVWRRNIWFNPPFLISLEMLVPNQGHCGFPSFPVVDWFFLFVDLWVFTFPLEDCSVFGNFAITLILNKYLSVNRYPIFHLPSFLQDTTQPVYMVK